MTGRGGAVTRLCKGCSPGQLCRRMVVWLVLHGSDSSVVMYGLHWRTRKKPCGVLGHPTDAPLLLLSCLLSFCMFNTLIWLCCAPQAAADPAPARIWLSLATSALTPLIWCAVFPPAEMRQPASHQIWCWYACHAGLEFARGVRRLLTPSTCC